MQRGLSSEIKFAFSDMILRKDKAPSEKNCKDTDERMKNFSQQKEIGYTGNLNIAENYLGVEKVTRLLY